MDFIFTVIWTQSFITTEKFGEALEPLRRPTAGQQGGCRGGQRPAAQHLIILLF